MNYAEASEIVAHDIRQSYPEMTDAEALEHAINTVDPKNVDGDDENAEAYRVVLRSADPDAPLLDITKLTAEQFSTLAEELADSVLAHLDDLMVERVDFSAPDLTENEHDMRLIDMVLATVVTRAQDQRL